MNISPNGIALISTFEQLRESAYPDPGTGGAPWTLGYGHTAGVKEGDTCNPDQALAWLQNDAQGAAACVNAATKVILTQNQFDALASLVFNIGCHNFDGSGLLKTLNAGDYQGASRHFSAWNKANGTILAGLSRRRQAEMELFLSKEAS